MEYYDFQHIFDEYSKKVAAVKAEEHNIGKIRDKFSEIVELVGVDSSLLRKYRDETSGEMVNFGKSNRQFCFPETICDFCVELIMRYTSMDYKLLRKGQYEEVALEELKFLIDGFTRYLMVLGYDMPTILIEKYKMNKRLNYYISLYLFQLNQEFRDFIRDVEKYENSSLSTLYDDRVWLTWYTVEKFKKFREDIDSIYSFYYERRNKEIDDFAEENAMNISNAEAMEDIRQSALLADALEHDQEYQTLLQEQMKILSTKDYLKKLKSSYDRNNEQLDIIRNKYRSELFGNMIQEIESICNDVFTHPVYMLHEAIKLADEEELERVKEKEREGAKKEQLDKVKAELLKSYPQFFEIPDCEQFESVIKKKNSIKCPCCHQEELIVYEGATGCIVSKCPRSGKQIYFNLDNMSAEIYEIPKGHIL